MKVPMKHEPDASLLEQAQKIKACVEYGLLGLPGVLAVDLGYRLAGRTATDDLAIRVYVDRHVLADEKIPAAFDGVPTDVIGFDFGRNLEGDGALFQSTRISGTLRTAREVDFSTATAHPYDHFGLQTGTPLHETGGNFEFFLSHNLDLYAIKKSATGTGRTEIHILTAASNYQEFRIRRGTALPETDDRWTFGIYGAGHVVGIQKSGTDSGMTELHFMSPQDEYQTVYRKFVTALHQTDASYKLLLQTLGNLCVIKKRGGGSGKTEMHILSWGSDYRQYLTQAPTVLPETGEEYDFQVEPRSPAPDLYVIWKRTGTGKTRIHILSAASRYTDYRLRVNTAVEESDDTFNFLLAPQYRNPSFYVLKKSGTGTRSTEVHVLPG
jgi:hypothetical protein